MTSYMDFNKFPVLNTLVSWKNIREKPTCYLGPAGYLPPFKTTFLRDVRAVYADVENTVEHGKCEKWSFFMSATTFVTFFFDEAKRFVRFDLIA